MAKFEENSMYVEKNGFWQKVKNFFSRIIMAIKNFFYDVSYNISVFSTKVFGKRKSTVKAGRLALQFSHTRLLRIPSFNS